MDIKKIYFTIMLTVVWIMPGFSQEPEGYEAQQNLMQLGREGNMNVVRTYAKEYEGVRGTPLLLKDWAKGKIVLHSGKIYDDLQLKYDVYKNSILAKRNKMPDIYLNNDQIYSFVIYDPDTQNGRRFKKLDSSVDGIEKNQFFEVIYEGKWSFLALHKKIFLKADYKGAYSAGKAYDEFKDHKDLYVYAPDGSLHKYKPRVNKLAKILGMNKKEISGMLEAKRLSLEDSQDVAVLLKEIGNL